MIVARTEAELARGLATVGDDRRIALVPTMGALHTGHMALVSAARAAGNTVVASIFVNPLQFDAQSDLARYPVDVDADLEQLSNAGCMLVWLPTADVIYPPQHATTIEVGGPACVLEGLLRPGHFRGVATVVAILLGQVRPHSVWFGEKDWQQLQVVRRMVADLRLAVEVRSIETVRSTDGLALSSRNRFLAGDERSKAPMLASSLLASAKQIADGEAPAVVLDRCRAVLTQAGFAVEYLLLADGETLVAVDRPVAGARLLAAARLGGVRLIDNIPV